jgi:predicted Zn-dependent protease
LLGDVTGLAAVLADQGVPLFLMKHSRDLETEADRYAVDTLLKAGVNPRGLVEALHILDEESKKLIKDTPLENAEKVFSKLELWSTHPNMNTRIEEIEKYISSHKHPQQDLRIEFDYSAFRKAVQANY